MERWHEENGVGKREYRTGEKRHTKNNVPSPKRHTKNNAPSPKRHTKNNAPPLKTSYQK